MIKQQKASSNGLIPVFFVFFLDNFGFAVVFSIFGLLLLDPSFEFLRTDADARERNLLLGILLAAFPLTQFFGTPFLGDIADRFGRKRAFYLTISGCLAGFLLSGIAIHLKSYSLLLLSRLLTGFFAGNQSICFASVGDLSSSERGKQKNFAIIALLGGVSWILAVILGGYLSNPAMIEIVDPSLPFWITAFFFFLSLLGISAFFDETQPSKEPFSIDLLKGARNIVETLYIPGLRSLYAVYFFWILGWGIAFQWMAPFSLERYHISAQEMTWGLILLGITWLIGSYPLNNFLIRFFSSQIMVTVGLFFTTVFLLLAGISITYTLFVWMVSFGGIPSAFSWSNLLTLQSEAAPKELQGKIMGMSQSSMSLGFIAATLIGGLVGAYALPWMYIVAGFFVLMGFLLIMRRAIAG